MKPRPRQLPSVSNFADNLISELGYCQSKPESNANDAGATARHISHSQNLLSGLTGPQLAKAKSLMLTLHCLFPNDLLPALDILDRRLVRRIARADKANLATVALDHNRTTDQTHTEHPGEAPISHDTQPPSAEDIFLVMSASSIPQPTASSTTHVHEKGYEVRLDAWNCTCPTFALSAFRDLQTRTGLPAELPSNAYIGWDQDEPRCYPFGGTLPCATDRASPPVCKHVLASVLFARCPQFEQDAGEHPCLVTEEELAGWCAGWGG